MIHITEKKLLAAIQIALVGECENADRTEAKLLHYIKALSIADVSGMLPEQTKQDIDLAYLTGVFNVAGFDGLHKELTRLKEIGKKPHDIFTESNYR